METFTPTADGIAKANILALVDDLGFTKAQLARRLGVSRAQLTKMLGATSPDGEPALSDRPLRVDELVAFSSVLSVPVSVLLTPRQGSTLTVHRPHVSMTLEPLQAWLWVVGIQPPEMTDWTSFYRSAEEPIRSWQAKFLEVVLGTERFRFDEAAGVVEFLDEDGRVVLTQRTREA